MSFSRGQNPRALANNRNNKMQISKCEVVLDDRYKANIPCLMHDTRHIICVYI